jgi:hypothetical protein
MGDMRVEPSWRQGAGMALILAWIVLWCVVVASVGGLIAGKPWWVQTPFYLVAGIVWIFPLRPLLRWMETGRWRSLEDPE